MEQQATDLAQRLQDDLAGDLRAVAIGSLDPDTYEVGYIREELAEAYPEDTRDEIFQEIVMERIAKLQQAALFDELGEPQSTVRTFENGVYRLSRRMPRGLTPWMKPTTRDTNR